MIGFSLPPRLFTSEIPTLWKEKLPSAFGDRDAFLRLLRQLGTTHIELRAILPQDDPDEVLSCARMLWESGFQISVHGLVPGSVGPFRETYPSLLPLLREAKARQPWVTVTLHAYVTGDDTNKSPAAEQTNRLLKLWESDAEELGLRIALELNRDKKNGDPSVTCEGILAMLEGTDPRFTGICFDMGHYYSNIRTTGAPENTVPDPAFLSRVIHTHIHALGAAGTHFPFAQDTSLPLDLYVEALKAADYAGIYNLELEFNRWPERSFRDAVCGSAAALKNAIEG